jgi:hypothetical protein
MRNHIVVLAMVCLLYYPATSLAVESFSNILSHYGMNASESLLNPAEPDVNQQVLNVQAARLIYDLRAGGGEVLRWMSTDVWPQWRCSSDPENADGQIDPNWFDAVSTLLKAADEQGVKVVVSLADLTNASFAAWGTGAVAEAKLEQWAQYRLRSAGKDRYPLDQHDCDARVPYVFAPEAAIFTDPQLRARFLRRITTMAKFLAGFPALGAIELFNEPEFGMTHSPGYWSAVREMLRAVKAADPALAKVPVYSGTAAWDWGIVAEAAKSGALELEPFLSVHTYDDYTEPEAKLDAALNGLIDYLHQLAPGKPIIIAEAGSKVPLYRLEDNAKMIRVLLRLSRTRHIGLWVWGDWFPAEHDVDYKWDFNPRSAAGPSLAPYFFDAGMINKYTQPRQIAEIAEDGKAADLTLSVERTDDPDPFTNGLWSIRLNSRRFLGFSRAGAFPRRADPPEAFAAPPPTYFTSEAATPREWAAISQTLLGWRLDEYKCAPTSADAIPTPEALLGLAENTRRRDFADCQHSILVATVGSL